VALAVTLLMTPAALHRLAFGGEDDPTFFRIGSGLVIAAAFPLALGIAADIYVVFLKISDQAGIALAAASLRCSCCSACGSLTLSGAEFSPRDS
jgi:hypothetical protein